MKALETTHATRNPALCAYKRVTVEKHGKAEVDITIPARSFTCVDEEGKRYVDSEAFQMIVSLCGGTERGERLSGTKNQEIILKMKA